MSTHHQENRYTHIPIVFRDEYSDKTYGAIVLTGEMTDAQRAELNGYLVGAPSAVPRCWSWSAWR